MRYTWKNAALASSFRDQAVQKPRPEKRAAMSHAVKLKLSGNVELAETLRQEIKDAKLEIGNSSGDEFGQFEPSRYLEALQTSTYGKVLLTTRSLASTQALMLDNRKIVPHGTVCVTDVQMKGKGRGGNVWTSPEGCLMASMFIKTCIEGSQLPFTQYVACLAVISALQEIMSEQYRLPTAKDLFPFRIKWPNDIYALSGNDQKRLKVGGILCNSLVASKGFNVIVGIGLNVHNAEPTTCVNELIQEAAQAAGNASTQPVLDREILLATVMNHFEDFQTVRCSYIVPAEVLENDGFDALESTYRRYWLHENERLLVGESQIPMTVQGISKSGYLRAKDDNGEDFELHPDSNSLDLMQGMISRKVAC